MSKSKDQYGTVDAALIGFRASLLEKLPEEKRPLSWTMGYVERPAYREHAKASTGKATVALLAVGWKSKGLHMEVKETKTFGDGIAPVRAQMLPSTASTDMRHVSFIKA